MLAYPEVDSPLNVDLAALIRGGDVLGARGLVGFWAENNRYEGI
jgi:peroxin-4